MLTNPKITASLFTFTTETLDKEFYNPGAYSEPDQTSKVGQLLAVNYFHKKLHLRCLAGFWIHLYSLSNIQ